jgi:hypothetical protein
MIAVAAVLWHSLKSLYSIRCPRVALVALTDTNSEHQFQPQLNLAGSAGCGHD